MTMKRYPGKDLPPGKGEGRLRVSVVVGDGGGDRVDRCLLEESPEGGGDLAERRP
jgi:hypothetical protein